MHKGRRRLIRLLVVFYPTKFYLAPSQLLLGMGNEERLLPHTDASDLSGSSRIQWMVGGAPFMVSCLQNNQLLFQLVEFPKALLLKMFTDRNGGIKLFKPNVLCQHSIQTFDDLLDNLLYGLIIFQDLHSFCSYP